MFLFANGDKDVFEVAVFAESCRSWLIDNTVQQGKRSNNFFKIVCSVRLSMNPRKSRSISMSMNEDSGGEGHTDMLN